MGRLIVIEGLDGAGKRTLADKLTAAFAEQGATVGTRAFPRYGLSVTADLVQDGLHGRLGGLGDSVYGMAVLYALDRQGARDDLLSDLASFDVVLLDRFVASNAAYGAARLHESADGDFVSWVKSVEIDRFGLPVPHAQLLLRVSAELAAERATHRENVDARVRDNWESDTPLQVRVGQVYDELAAKSWLSPWHVVDGSTDLDVLSLTGTLLA
ncbi:dTMP kinase [Actinokineospora globicatena]|uniref:dTMP kinase n=1 Tax=Actinokineospora globicatena TaxID=103729 RepID=UPI0020A23BF0|nr:dTMP kinase [Actinokineospora globicatena]MCP2302115.1 dTMP kinase [Actinokineospora globicatena]GLW76223.1 dTMP kinase [Actinokineospora globicatena]GLW83059.1 dTMP kinase [Actinokineospora globicatena]